MPDGCQGINGLNPSTFLDKSSLISGIVIVKERFLYKVIEVSPKSKNTLQLKDVCSFADHPYP